MSPHRLTILVAAIVWLGLAGMACGGAEESSSFESTSDRTTAESAMAMDDDDMAMEEMEMEMMMAAAAEVFEASAKDVADSAFDDSAFSSLSSSGPVARPVSQQRMIVRSAEVGIQVEDVEGSLSRIGTLASDLGGWVVSSEESLTYTGFISVRVPAEKLDSASPR